jgi:hypothetical protein
MKILGNGRIFLEKGEQFPLVCPKCTGYVEFTDAPVVKPKALEWYLLILDGVPGKLDLQIGSHACRFGCRFGQSCAHADHGKLRAARRLEHMQIAVAMGIVNTGTILANQSAAPMLILPSTAGLTNSGTLSVLTGDTMQVGTAAGGALTNFAGTTLTGGTYTVGGTLQFGASGTSITTDAANLSLTGAGAKNSRAKRKGEGLCCPQIHVLPYASSSRAEPHRLCRPDSLLR